MLVNDYNTRISEIGKKITTDHNHDKYITTQEFNKLTSAKSLLQGSNKQI